MMMLQMFSPSVLLASLPDNLLTRKSCKQFDFRDFMTSRKKLINHKEDINKMWAKRKPEGQSLSLKSQWRACSTLLKALPAAAPCLPSPLCCTEFCLLAPCPKDTDGVLLDWDVQNMGIPSYIFSPIFTYFQWKQLQNFQELPVLSTCTGKKQISLKRCS